MSLKALVKSNKEIPDSLKEKFSSSNQLGGVNKLKCMLENNSVLIDQDDVKSINRHYNGFIDMVDKFSYNVVNVNNIVNLVENMGNPLPKDKYICMVTAKLSALEIMKYYISFKRLQDIDILKEELFKNTLRNGDLRISYKTYHEFKYKTKSYSYTLETIFNKGLGDSFEVKRLVHDLMDLNNFDIVVRKTDKLKVIHNQSIKSRSMATTLDMLNDVSLALLHCIDNKVEVKNGLDTFYVEDQYKNNHPDGKFLIRL